MSTAEYIVLLVVCGIATYLTRMPALVLADRIKISPRARRFMSFIGPSVIAALIAPAVFVRDGSLLMNPVTNYYIPAAAVTALTAFLFKKSLPAIIAGVGTAFILSITIL